MPPYIPRITTSCPRDMRESAYEEIEREMEERVEYFKSQNKLIEAQRIEERTRYDLEMLREIGYCSGIENYSRVFAGREPGSTPYTLLDYFPNDFITFIDESHVTVPQVRGMTRRPRKKEESRRLRLPPALGIRQPPALLRGIREEARSDRSRYPRPPRNTREAAPVRSSSR